ncbi:hypothetical protein F441_16008 [Phytophthora nicotianae CJ01A1]|uniref:PX domain-containing protein n=5 Tax=Phytophthora nicotianae TaxID=4792 RepID=W2PU02_PHYN3|nr:hypothetical protein PPTG_15727 [Phytophthora nicotianae INRA-310]ETK78193.1 hypothetical protein L915_15736 [Phytophthora nicotianae]ETO66753.1 hypothetical protein F444_16163 [Phytophthora nicotianae P1976]ETP07880.1 hypothetical protein F441_16008 [Phytophthora nicotianae CJ01A1]ETP35915.1 hypothetical protein F442_16031 [Phytophthora nicotianae P10297]KUF79086.1 hypothetical protein AM587_10011985 [Phytophthora nicotianae]
MAYLTMTPDDIQGDYTCSVSVEDYRLSSKKAEYKVVVQLSFYSSRAHATGRTSWHIWRSFSAFRKLDEQLRKRSAALMKGVKFPPLYRRRALFRVDKSPEFLGARARELDNYMNVVTHKPQLVAFHLAAVSSQTLKSFVGFNSGFGANAEYDQQDSSLRPSSSILASPAVVQATASVMGDDDDDFRSVSSSSTVSSFASNASDYRWSGTGFVGSQSFARHTAPQNVGRTSFSSSRGSFAGSIGPGSSRGSWFPASSTVSDSTGRASLASLSRGSMMSMTAPDVITPELDMQRAKMEDQLVQTGLVGVGMPPDGSCLLHCIVYEMYPLQCLRDYPASMTVVNVGAADGMAPRRVAAAQFLRVKLMEYALEHVKELAGFLMQDEEDVRERYETFRDTPDEQATTAELYAVASMFNIELVLISNDESFQIDPVLPVEGLPSVREGPRRTVTLGYLIPADGLAGHYICTREQRAQMGMPQNTFAGGSYRGSIHIGPPKNMSCGASNNRRFERIPEQRVE